MNWYQQLRSKGIADRTYLQGLYDYGSGRTFPVDSLGTVFPDGTPAGIRNAISVATAIANRIQSRHHKLAPRGNVKWTLASMDDEFFMVGQFAADSFEIQGGDPKFAITQLPFRHDPRIQYSTGTEVVVTFQTRAVNIIPYRDSNGSVDSATKDVMALVSRMDDARRPVPGLGRPRKYVFNWGNGEDGTDGFKCFLAACKRKIGERWPNGAVKVVDFDMTLLVIPDDESPAVPADIDRPCVPRTYMTVMGDTTYEIVAKKAYADTAYGPALLKANRGKPLLAGTPLLIPCVEDLEKAPEPTPPLPAPPKKSPIKSKPVRVDACLARESQLGSNDEVTIRGRDGREYTVRPAAPWSGAFAPGFGGANQPSAPVSDFIFLPSE